MVQSNPHRLSDQDRPPLISVRGLTKVFNANDGPVLDGLDFNLFPQQTLSVIGPSGCGKTTLLYILAGLLPATSGSVNIGGNDPGHGRGHTAFILQHFGLFPWKTVFENVALGLKLQQRTKSMPADQIEAVVQARLDELGLGQLGRRYPVQLSGGQKQRVAIARALSTEPDILLMDEPFSSLDALTRERLQNTMLEMWQRRRLTYIIVTHSVEEAVFLGQFILVLSDRPTVTKALITNAHFGESGQRKQTTFFDTVRQVRKAMEI
jgi:NitT/TauT family transport system ATP-binding protein